VYGRCPLSQSRNPFTCGLTGKTYSALEFFQRSDHLARALSKRLSWQPNEGTPWDKVAGIFALNSVSILRHSNLFFWNTPITSVCSCIVDRLYHGGIWRP
jgi:hypothetical protein